MSSFKISKATAPSVIGGSYTVNSGGAAPIIIGPGTVTVSADDIKSLTGAKEDRSVRMLISAVSGEPNVEFYETQADGTKIKACFEPDSGMAVTDLTKVMMLIIVLRDGSNTGPNPISYIRSHNLERHFRFSTA